MKVSCTRRGGLRRPSLGKCPGGRRWARSRDCSNNGRRAGRGKWGPHRGRARPPSSRPPSRGEGRGSWALGPGSSTQVTSRPGQTPGDTWERGRGLASGSWDSSQGRKFCTGPRAVPKPAGCQRSSSSATPGPTVSFPAARAFWFRASPHAGLAPALGGQPLGTTRRNPDAAPSPRA
ncbi:soluble scavenger receptor cysteine-rich domain-containing protein SSC5D-like [Mustela erminea]|uniref:soluble scavenger receptor cysteine-rich domain-containing protein SSC5D-like n=1 Tax=Mustela erminea TaxID=36723 RepID=UPI001386EEED|nr:soluble scavenger receptor cysteine-rich domain-containing protein SSC5D-like [Mustela erminea]XP_032209552.1 soluble scavenger receptor cysteine-rich domain-containing protein SSC5D-like [Mustela erminea]